MLMYNAIGVYKAIVMANYSCGKKSPLHITWEGEKVAYSVLYSLSEFGLLYTTLLHN